MTQKNDGAMRKPVDGITPADAAALLTSLRWREDTVITNHDGERVWLKVCYDKTGKRIGITDCCPADDPCPRHKGFTSAGGGN